MSKIRRRAMLRALGAAVTGTAVTVLGSRAVYAAFSPPVRGRRYQRYGGHNFSPNSTFKDGQRTDRTYNDNGSIYVTGTPSIFNTRLQLPDGAVVEEVQFNYFLGSLPPMVFQLLAFDNANGYQSNIPSAQADSPDSSTIQTINLAGLPVRVDNAAWNYVLRWAPQAADTEHILWGARVGYRTFEGDQ
jgi:hypothetical protein